MGSGMLVFIDESGDAGFKIAKGSSLVFAMAMVWFGDRREAERTQKIIDRGLDTLRAYPEFKFNKCNAARRDGFFELVSECQFNVRAAVVEKNLIRPDRFRSDEENFYNLLLRAMLHSEEELLRDATVVIDGSGDRVFKRRLSASLRKYVAHGTISSVKMRDSRSDSLVQLADMCAGAIARSYRKDREDSDRWLKMLGAKIDNIWELK